MPPFNLPDTPKDTIDLIHFFKNQIAFCNSMIAKNHDRSRFWKRDVLYYQSTVDALQKCSLNVR